MEIVSTDALRIKIGEMQYTVNYTLVSDHQVHLNVNGTGLNAFVTGGPEGKVVWIDGISYLVQDADLATQSTKKRGNNSNLPSEVTPLTPSVVVALLVKAGDKVTKGQGVIVLSAMKMETTLNAPYAGTVLSIHTEMGAKVAPGDILVDIEKTEQESGTEVNR
jgi:acetyl/propionyl-CoA carboxylase alpha subunit